MKKLIVITAMILICGACPYAIADANYSEIASTTNNLGNAGVYTSPVFATHTLQAVNVNITADQNSASNGLKINYINTSEDCSSFTPTSANMDYTANGSGWTYTASTKDSYESAVRGNCAWVTYTNGGSAQSSFKLTIFGNLK